MGKIRCGFFNWNEKLKTKYIYKNPKLHVIFASTVFRVFIKKIISWYFNFIRETFRRMHITHFFI